MGSGKDLHTDIMCDHLPKTSLDTSTVLGDKKHSNSLHLISCHVSWIILEACASQGEVCTDPMVFWNWIDSANWSGSSGAMSDWRWLMD